MNDPVKGEGRMTTDASGVTRREGGILGMWSNIFPERNGSNEWICPYISRHLLSLNPLQARCRRYSRGER